MKDLLFSDLTIPREIPKNWYWAKLDDVCVPQTGTRDPSKKPDEFFRYVDISSIDNRVKRIVEPKQILGSAAPSRARQVILSGDVLVATTRPNLNAVALVPTDLQNQICSTGFCVLRPIPDQLHADYLFAYVQHHQFVKGLSELVKGAMYPAVTDTQVRSQIIPLPPLPEQRRIAAILAEQMADVERARAAAEVELEAVQQLKQKCLQLEFEHIRTENWNPIQIEKICTLVRGSSPRPKDDPQYYGGSYPRLMVADITRDGIHVTPRIDTLTDEGAKQSRFMKAGSIVMVVSGSAGLPAVLNTDAYIHDGFVGLRDLDPRIDTMFFIYWLIERRTASALEASGAIWQNLTTGQIKTWGFPLLPLEEQHRIAENLSIQLIEIDEVLSTLEIELEGINQLPTALLRKAFNGEL